MKFFRLSAIFVIFQIFSTILFAAEIQNINNDLNKATQLKSINPKPSSGLATLGSIYRNTRQARCYRCYESEGSSRYPDDSRGYYPSSRSHTSGYSDDRAGSWYTRSHDRYDDRARYYDDRYPERTPAQSRPDYYGGSSASSAAPAERYPSRYNDKYYDDPYYFRTYDRYDRYDKYDKYDRYTPNRYERERYYPAKTYDRPREYEDRQEGYGRDRYHDRYDSRYPERDDRYPPPPPPPPASHGSGYESGGGYRVSYRPYDDYRGQSAIDTNTGRGYWFADRPSDRYPYHDRPDSGPPPPHGPPPYGAGPNYLPNNGQPPPHPLQGGSNTNTSSGQPGQDYEYKRPPPHNAQEQPNKDGYAGGWNYSNDRDKNNNNNNLGYNQNDRDKDVMSSPYGSRSRPLTGSYLLDRETNDPTKAVNQPNDNNNNNNSKPDGQMDKVDSSNRIDSKNAEGQKKPEISTKKLK